VLEPAQSGQPDFKPHLFGKFFVLQRLAIGGMAEIYRSKVVGASGFEKELALKRILPARSQDQGFIQMLVNEAKLTAQLTHSNIAQIYECGEVDGTYFIAMELVHGVSMKEMMAAFARSGVTLSPEQAIFLVLQLLQGLDYAHRKTGAEGEPLRIVHCDVSPDNALISWEGELKLLDFGIARAAAGLSNYKEGMLMGKLGYVAPEQASIERTWDHRVDLFAAGIILYELLTHQKPFPKATDVDSLVSSRKAKVVPPSVLDERIPKELDAILARALDWNPDRRFPSARAFADSLVDVLFPTPHSTIQDLLGQHMRQVFAERITRQRAARGHDALVVKVLQNLIEQGHRDDGFLRDGAEPLFVLPPSGSDPGRPEERPGKRSGTTRGAARPRQAGSRDRGRPWYAIALGTLALSLGAVGLWAGAVWVHSGVLVLTSEPPGAQVSLDGRLLSSPTPVAVEGVDLWRPTQVVFTAKDHRTVALTAEPNLGRLVRRLHADLPGVLGSIVVESRPPGAQVQIDDEPAGVTPLTIPNVRLDQRHRVDLALLGHELDQFVVLPEKDGRRFSRTLSPTARRAATRPPAARAP